MQGKELVVKERGTDKYICWHHLMANGTPRHFSRMNEITKILLRAIERNANHPHIYSNPSDIPFGTILEIYQFTFDTVGGPRYTNDGVVKVLEVTPNGIQETI